jgi:hypothetical protein
MSRPQAGQHFGVPDAHAPTPYVQGSPRTEASRVDCDRPVMLALSCRVLEANIVLRNEVHKFRCGATTLFVYSQLLSAGSCLSCFVFLLSIATSVLLLTVSGRTVAPIKSNRYADLLNLTGAPQILETSHIVTCETGD